MIWTIDPKITSSEITVVEIAAYIAVCIFNNGYINVLKIMELLGVRIGLSTSQFRDNKDKQRFSLAYVRAQATHKERLRRKQSRNEVEEVVIVTEDTLYASGLNALWFITKFYRFT